MPPQQHSQLFGFPPGLVVLFGGFVALGLVRGHLLLDHPLVPFFPFHAAWSVVLEADVCLLGVSITLYTEFKFHVTFRELALFRNLGFFNRGLLTWGHF